MTIARQLLKAFRLARESRVNLFRSGASAQLAAMPGWAGCSLGTDPATPMVAPAEALRALALQSAEDADGRHSVSLVATGPASTSELATTRATVIELVDTAVKELLLLGFAISDRRLHEALVGAAGRGVEVVIVGERLRDDILDLARRWPATVPPATFLQMVEPPAGVSSIMHAKVVVADQSRVLIGSANFTGGGLKHNLELGLRVEGPVAVTIVRLVSTLRERRWLEPVPL